MSELQGDWRVTEHGIFCGTLRIAKFDFDTDPSGEFKEGVYRQMQVALGGHAELSRRYDHAVDLLRRVARSMQREAWEDGEEEGELLLDVLQATTEDGVEMDILGIEDVQNSLVLLVERLVKSSRGGNPVSSRLLRESREYLRKHGLKGREVARFQDDE